MNVYEFVCECVLFVNVCVCNVYVSMCEWVYVSMRMCGVCTHVCKCVCVSMYVCVCVCVSKRTTSFISV